MRTWHFDEVKMNEQFRFRCIMNHYAKHKEFDSIDFEFQSFYVFVDPHAASKKMYAVRVVNHETERPKSISWAQI